jgi:hypothetical protein
VTKYYLKYETYDFQKYNAGGKAVEDCFYILDHLGYKPFRIQVNLPHNKFSKSMANLKLFRLMHLHRDDIIVIPHPMGLMHRYVNIISFAQRAKKFKTCYLIHDLLSIRHPQNSGCEYIDKKMIENADAVIVHNDSMGTYIHNVNSSIKVVSLKVFDYLGSINKKEKKKACTLNIAGNLTEDKAQYIYHTEHLYPDIIINLFGPGYNSDKISVSNIKYFGKFPPDDIPKVFSEGFGLVWDGPSIETCSGNMGNYLRYNNPHKLSLYLSAGLPVVVWDQSATKKFVIENNVGIAVSSINDFYNKYKSLTEYDYREMCRNADKISQKLHQGYFLATAMKKVEKMMS